MSPQGWNADDYVDVAERIAQFYERFPDGRLERVGWGITTMGERLFVHYEALAYRTADDPHPAPGTAWEPFPGPTAFTRESELMNAETAAWGRAIIAAGIPSKKIASREEVEARQGERSPQPKAAAKANGAGINPERIRNLRSAFSGSGCTDKELGMQLIALDVQDYEPVVTALTAGTIKRGEAKAAAARLTGDQADALQESLEQVIAQRQADTPEAA